MTAWEYHGEAPRELMGPRGLWVLRCWRCGASSLPKIGWFGMHATDSERRSALARLL